MPVLECSCGMVMSVSVAKPRNTCIRCGGVEFRKLERFRAAVNAMDCAPLVPITTCGNYLSRCHWQSAGKATTYKQSPVVLSKRHVKIW